MISQTQITVTHPAGRRFQPLEAYARATPPSYHVPVNPCYTQVQSTGAYCTVMPNRYTGVYTGL